MGPIYIMNHHRQPSLLRQMRFKSQILKSRSTFGSNYDFSGCAFWAALLRQWLIPLQKKRCFMKLFFYTKHIVHKDIRIFTHICRHNYMHTYVHTRARARAPTHTHTHTHTHTCITHILPHACLYTLIQTIDSSILSFKQFLPA